MTLLETVAVVLTLVAVFLTTRQIVWCWPLGMISVVLYGAVFYEAKLYADMGLQAIYFGLSVYGWWAWTRGSESSEALEVSVLSTRSRLGIAAGAGLGGALLGLGLDRFTDASLPLADSSLTSFSIAAQWLQARKHLEAWWIWMAVDVLYVILFIYKELYLTAGLYAVFVYLATLGLMQWRGTMPAPAGAKR